jgi:hypothetical protein
VLVVAEARLFVRRQEPVGEHNIEVIYPCAERAGELRPTRVAKVPEP